MVGHIGTCGACRSDGVAVGLLASIVIVVRDEAHLALYVVQIVGGVHVEDEQEVVGIPHAVRTDRAAALRRAIWDVVG